MKRPIRYSIRLLLVLLTVTAIVVGLLANDQHARRRVITVRTMGKEGAAPNEILETLRNPMRIDFGQSYGHGYYSGLNWSPCLEPSWPFVHVPIRTYVLVECKNSVVVNHIWLDHGDDRSLELLFPDRLSRDGCPEYVTIRHY